MPAKPTVSSDQSLQRIKSAAVSLFARQGYVATGIRDIAREAGLSSATLYHHVVNKEELLVAIMCEAFEELIGNAVAAMAGQTSPADMLTALVRQHVLTETVNQTIANVATVEFRFLGPTARLQVVPLRDRYEKIWDDVLDKGIIDNTFQLANSKIVRLALIQLCGGPEEWFRPDGKLSAEDLADLYAELALRLVGAERPCKPVKTPNKAINTTNPATSPRPC